MTYRQLAEKLDSIAYQMRYFGDIRIDDQIDRHHQLIDQLWSVAFSAKMGEDK